MFEGWPTVQQLTKTIYVLRCNEHDCVITAALHLIINVNTFSPVALLTSAAGGYVSSLALYH